MAGEVEPAKKIMLPYLQRADELKQHEPLVAYYCRLYAMERGLKIPTKERSKTTNAILISLMSQLEKDKKSIQLGPEDNFYVEGFASSVFAKADKQDRSRRADLNTAKTFYAASIFIEILHQFGPLQPDMEQKQKYAVWKAADIRKALSEGRKPVPGPPGGDTGLSISSIESLDTEFSLEKAAGNEPEHRISGEAGATAGFDVPSVNTNGLEKLNRQVSHPADNHHGSVKSEPTSNPQQPPDPLQFGYLPPNPGSYYPSSSTPFASAASSSMNAHEYGVQPQVDGSGGQFHHSNYQQYTPILPDEPVGSSMPTPYYDQPGGSDAVFYQSPVGHARSGAVYPGSVFTSSDHGSFSSAEVGTVRPKDPSGLERTTSAPANVKGQIFQPPPDKIAEAHKASRFAVSALAFDDVPAAISYLKQSLELLTNPSASLQP